MLLNPSDAMLCGTEAQRCKVDTSAGINVPRAHVQSSKSVKLLGVQLDNALPMDSCVCCYSTVGQYHGQLCLLLFAITTSRLCDTSDCGLISTLPRWSPRESLPLDSTVATVWCAACPPGICVACRSPRTHLPGQCVTRRGLPAPLSCVVHCTGCHSDNASTTRRHVPGSVDWSSGVHHVTAARLRSRRHLQSTDRLLLQSPFCRLKHPFTTLPVNVSNVRLLSRGTSTDMHATLVTQMVQ